MKVPYKAGCKSQESNEDNAIKGLDVGAAQAQDETEC